MDIYRVDKMKECYYRGVDVKELKGSTKRFFINLMKEEVNRLEEILKELEVNKK